MEIPQPTKPLDEMTETEQRTYAEQLVEFFRPEARELVREALTGESLYSLTTKDGYGYVLGALTGLEPALQGIVLTAMVREGYPMDSAGAIAQILGL